MKHLEKEPPPPTLSRRETPRRPEVEHDSNRAKPGRAKSYLGGVLLGIALVGTTGWGLTAMFGARHNDQVTEQDRAQRLVSYAQMKPLVLMAVNQSEWNEALDSMQLSPKDREALLKDIALPGSSQVSGVSAQPAPAVVEATRPAAKQALVWVTLWDSHAQDGDIVLIQSGGYQQNVTLLNKPARLAVPMPPSGVLNIVGVHDGGGGITAGAMSGNNPVALPIMSEGQSIGVPVTAP